MHVLRDIHIAWHPLLAYILDICELRSFLAEHTRSGRGLDRGRGALMEGSQRPGNDGQVIGVSTSSVTMLNS